LLLCSTTWATESLSTKMTITRATIVCCCYYVDDDGRHVDNGIRYSFQTNFLQPSHRGAYVLPKLEPGDWALSLTRPPCTLYSSSFSLFRNAAMLVRGVGKRRRGRCIFFHLSLSLGTLQNKHSNKCKMGGLCERMFFAVYVRQPMVATGSSSDLSCAVATFSGTSPRSRSCNSRTFLLAFHSPYKAIAISNR
jgi:hypothetical protein